MEIEMELAIKKFGYPGYRAILVRSLVSMVSGMLGGQTFSILMTYADAKSLAESTPGLSGVGFVIPPGLPGYAVVDLDDCYQDGNLKPAAQTIISNLRSYTERSPSGKGLHIIVLADLQGYSKLATTIDGQSTEVLTPGNFVTFTGDTIQDPGIIDCTSILEQLYADNNIKKRTTPNRPIGVNIRSHPGSCSYGRACLRSECNRIRQAKVGSRAQTLLKGAYRMGRLIPGGHIDESAAVLDLERAGQSTGLLKEKVRKTVSDGLDEGKKNPRTDIKCGRVYLSLTND